MSSSTGHAAGAQWQAPSAPNMPSAPGSIPEEEGITIKSMRLKVLYTFDDQNKTNCLARWPAVLQIRTVMMDDTTTIGVIELKTCIQAIVQCSPELVATLGQDYTVYAYDFSEYDVPLVGQGMLSWALAASSPTPDGPASESQKLITGRVCKNIQALFSNGVKETLEVKLRLVPVPTVLQSEYLNSMEKYREVSRYIPASLDQNEWMGFLRSNPNIGQMANKINSMAPGSSHEVVNQLLSPSLSQHNSDPFNNPAGNEGTVTEDRLAQTAGRAGAKNSRPSSRASVKRPRKPRVLKTVVGGNTSGYEEGTDGEEGQVTKKRAKIVQGEWNGKSSFGTGSDSLLVAASTTNSIRTFRPIAIAPNPNPAAVSHLQEIPRAPTPVPGAGGKKQSLQRAMSQSNLRRDSIISQVSQSRYQSPYASLERSVLPQEQEVRMSIESAMSSPEKNNDSSGETPPDIASSPPVLMRGVSTRHSSPLAPSSPVLPKMPRQDSSFLVGDVDEINDLFGDDEMRSPDDRDIADAAQYSTRSQQRTKARGNKGTEQHHGFAFEEVTPGPMELLPKSQAEFEPRRPQASNSRPVTARANSRANSVMSDDFTFPPPTNLELQPSPLAMDVQTPLPAGDEPGISAHSGAYTKAQLPSTSVQLSRPSSASPYVPSLPPPTKTSRTASIGSLTLPTPASEPVLPPTSLSRSRTWSEAPCPPSDIAMASFTATGAFSKETLTKKELIRQKLDDAVRKGEMPPYCQNCGAIETPTWRRCYAQEHEGKPGYHEYSDEPGRVIAIDILTRDEDGQPTSYKLFKKSLGVGDDRHAFDEHLLCNPCGIWLSKFKQHRPEERWYKEPKPRPGKRGGGAKRKSQSNTQPMPTSEAYFQSDAPGPVDQSQGFHTDRAYGAPMTQFDDLQHTMKSAKAIQPSLPPMQRPRASSMRPTGPTKPAASQAAVSALRRAIQSSPARYLGSHHSPIEIDEEDLGVTRRTLFPSPRKDSSPKVLGELATNVILPITQHTPSRVKASIEMVDKENQAPAFDDDDPLEKLIEQAMLEQQRPKTPTPKTPSKIFKTPTRPTPSHRPVTRSISRSSRSNRQDTLPQRTPSKTPSRRSPRNHNGTVEESPFTRNLNMILSEANDHGHSPSRHLELGIEFLPSLTPNHGNLSSDALFHLPGFEVNQDFFSTDVPMPSSPPRFGSNFNLYEDPIDMSIGGLGHLNSDIWTEFQVDGANRGNVNINTLGGLLVDESGKATFSFENADSVAVVIKKEPEEEMRVEKDVAREKA